jgi:hypothetical protein
MSFANASVPGSALAVAVPVPSQSAELARRYVASRVVTSAGNSEEKVYRFREELRPPWLLVWILVFGVALPTVHFLRHEWLTGSLGILFGLVLGVALLIWHALGRRDESKPTTGVEDNA